MKIAYVADVHLGNHRRMGGPVASSLNERCRLALDVFDRAVIRARELGARLFVVVGDLLDGTRPEPQLLSEVQTITDGIETILMVGNHEFVSNQFEDHSLAPLEGSLDAPVVAHDSLLCVPFFPSKSRRETKEKLASIVGDFVNESRQARNHPFALAVHLGISDSSTAPWLKDSSDSIDVEDLVEICKANRVEYVFAGNWHDRRTWRLDGVYVYQLGALVPTGFDNPGLDGYGTLVVWDSITGSIQTEVIGGPRFLTDAVVTTADELPEGTKLFLSERVAVELMGSKTIELEGLKRLGLPIHAFEVVPDGALLAEAARSAGGAAGRAETVVEAISAYVEKMVLPEGASRGRVAELARKFVEASE